MGCGGGEKALEGPLSQLGPDLGLQLGMVLAQIVFKSKQGTREGPMFSEAHIRE